MENTEAGASPLVSIVVIAYNHLNYTKMCIDSLMEYTSDINYELITINNGSSDGTLEYFNSLPNPKKISFEENIGVDKAINYGFRIAEGKYTLNLSNDIIVTHNWLKNLVTCIESDEKIAMVVPVCGFSSNFQQVALPYKTIDEMQQQAEIYNISNPDLWEERLKLVTYTCLFRTDVQKSIGGFDEDFNPGAFDDDAISFRIRRLGYKLILAKDTYVHHFGSITFNAEYSKNNLVSRNVNLFRTKFGVNSWGVTMIDFNIMELVDYESKDCVNILGIGASCGSTLLQVKNEYRKHSVKNVNLFYLSQYPNCIPDLKTICEFCVCGDVMDAPYYFKNRLFDYIVVESETSKIPDIKDFFENFKDLLCHDGKIICTAPDNATLLQIDNALTASNMQQIKNLKNYYYCYAKTL